MDLETIKSRLTGNQKLTITPGLHAKLIRAAQDECVRKNALTKKDFDKELNAVIISIGSTVSYYNRVVRSFAMHYPD